MNTSDSTDTVVLAATDPATIGDELTRAVKLVQQRANGGEGILVTRHSSSAYSISLSSQVPHGETHELRRW
jgi:hypothetical protein